MKNENREGAIIKFKEAVKINPNSKTAYYNLACAYSILGETTKSFRYLNLAIDNGYNNFEKMETDPDLQHLVQNPIFQRFKDNGYQHVEPKSSSNASELEKLFELKEKGVISEDEYNTMKAKIINQ